MKIITQIKPAFITIVIIVLFLPCISQESNDSTSCNFKKIHFEALFSANLSYRISKSAYTAIWNGRPPLSWDIIAYKANQETPSFGFTVGALIEYRFHKHFGLSTGLILNDFSVNTKRIDTAFCFYSTYPGQHLICDNMYIQKKYLFLSIPVLYRIIFDKNRLQYYLNFGFSASYLAKYSRTFTFHNTNTNYWLPPDGIDGVQKDASGKRIMYDISVGLGLGVKTLKSLTICLEPKFTYFTNLGFKYKNDQFNTSAEIIDHYIYNEPKLQYGQYTIGLQVSIKY